MSDSPGGPESGPSGNSLEFDPIVNGVDFLDSAISHLSESTNPRSVKYAVLHLQAAIEILVKVRLQREGIEHIFEDPYSVDENKFRQGAFRSVTLNAAIKRLAKVADVQVSTAQRNALDALNKERNKLQHFGSTSNYEVVTARAAVALDVLSEFIRQHLVPDAPEDEVEHLELAENIIGAALTTITAVNRARLDRIAPELEAWQSIVIHCPECMQLAWTFAPFEETSCCRFCGHDWSHVDGIEAAEDYVTSVLGESRYLAAKGRSGWSISDCPECELEALILVATSTDPNSFHTNACFHCGFVADGDLGSCGRCGRTTSDSDDGTCADCVNDLAAGD
ncbi:hypothetical protein [Amycolatopsis sp. CA-230715]|uniref:hypothetical protein n=1 Tax=Amycolatopsis sp. CA-230715 TaxID=2745196 RepID=UPI001C01F3DC|nr:hypothetical protein [Amycolatopsis sp. CA-230715]QWF85637.1 hypothetical protein HUW46_09092 [Amycolatopsis sp. CA-230715]